MGRLIRNIQRQTRLSEIHPPMIGPQTGATRVVIAQMPRAVARLLGGKIEISSAWEPGIIGPDTAPCRIRNANSDGKSQATPHRKDAMVNSNTETTNVLTTP